jgi:hypothetical protein
LTFNGLRGVKSQNIEFFITTVVRASSAADMFNFLNYVVFVLALNPMKQSGFEQERRCKRTFFFLSLHGVGPLGYSILHILAAMDP